MGWRSIPDYLISHKIEDYKIKAVLNLVLLFLAFTAAGQTSPSGKYIGYERISPRFDVDGNIIYYSFHNKKKENWFHEVTLTIKDSLVIIQKAPVFFKKGKKNVSVNEAGYYSYHGFLAKTDSGWTVNTLMDSCRNCEQRFQAFLPLSNHLDTVSKIHDSALRQPILEHKIIFDPLVSLVKEYFIRPVKNGLLIDTYLQHDILFKRAD